MSFDIAIGQDRGRDRMAIQLLAQYSNNCRIRLKHVPMFIHECGIHYIRLVDKGKEVEGSGFRVQGSGALDFGLGNAEGGKKRRWEVEKVRKEVGSRNAECGKTESRNLVRIEERCALGALRLRSGLAALKRRAKGEIFEVGRRPSTSSDESKSENR